MLINICCQVAQQNKKIQLETNIIMSVPSWVVYGLMFISAVLIILGGWKDVYGDGKCRYSDSQCKCGKNISSGEDHRSHESHRCSCDNKCKCDKSRHMYFHISAQHLWADGLWFGILALFLQHIKNTQQEY